MRKLQVSLIKPERDKTINFFYPKALPFRREPFAISFRRPRNIKYFLVRAKLESEIQSDKGMFGCGKVRSKICKFVKTGSIFENTVEKKSSHINHSFNYD